MHALDDVEQYVFQRAVAALCVVCQYTALAINMPSTATVMMIGRVSPLIAIDVIVAQGCEMSGPSGYFPKKSGFAQVRALTFLPK